MVVWHRSSRDGKGARGSTPSFVLFKQKQNPKKKPPQPFSQGRSPVERPWELNPCPRPSYPHRTQRELSAPKANLLSQRVVTRSWGQGAARGWVLVLWQRFDGGLLGRGGGGTARGAGRAGCWVYGSWWRSRDTGTSPRSGGAMGEEEAGCGAPGAACS